MPPPAGTDARHGVRCCWGAAGEARRGEEEEQGQRGNSRKAAGCRWGAPNAGCKTGACARAAAQAQTVPPRRLHPPPAQAGATGRDPPTPKPPHRGGSSGSCKSRRTWPCSSPAQRARRTCEPRRLPGGGGVGHRSRDMTMQQRLVSAHLKEAVSAEPSSRMGVREANPCHGSQAGSAARAVLVQVFVCCYGWLAPPPPPPAPPRVATSRQAATQAQPPAARSGRASNTHAPRKFASPVPVKGMNSSGSTVSP